MKTVVKKFSLKGKKAFVTGAAGGIGRSTSAAFAEMGADVAVVDIKSKLEQSTEIAKQIMNKYGVKAIAIGADVSDPASVDKMVKNIVKEFGTIDVVHSNAGILGTNDNSTISLEEWNKIISVNLSSMLITDRAAANIMIAHKHSGAIINTASMSGHIINPSPEGADSMIAYTTSKAGVIHLTKALAVNYIKYGIRVNRVSYGYIYSGIHDGMKQSHLDFWTSTVPIKRFGTLDEVAGIVTFLATDLASYMVGSDVIVDGGYCIY